MPLLLLKNSCPRPCQRRRDLEDPGSRAFDQWRRWILAEKPFVDAWVASLEDQASDMESRDFDTLLDKRRSHV